MVEMTYAKLSALPLLLVLIYSLVHSCSAGTQKFEFFGPLQSFKKIGEIEWEILQLATGDYNDTELDHFHQGWIEDVKYIYTKVSKAIEKEKSINKEVALENIKSAVEMVRNIYDQIRKLRATKTVGKLTLDFFRRLFNLVELIMDQNIRELEDMPSLNFGKDNFITFFNDISNKYKVWFNKNPKIDEIQSNGVELYIMGTKLFIDIEEIEPPNQIAIYIYDGFKLITRRWMALFAYLKSGGENRLKVKWA